MLKLLPPASRIRQSVARLATLAASALIFSPCHGQTAPAVIDADQYLNSRVPSSPTTAALERYATMPVREHTGTPEVSIPLFEIKSRQLSLPIALSYHAGGIRVTDDASWVGLGWSLQAGGMVSRSLRSLPDEKENIGFLDKCQTIRQAAGIVLTNDYLFVQSVAEQREDNEPDLFSYSFPEGSGQFMYGNDGRVHTIPYAPLTITPSLRGPNSRVDITAPSGNVYQFTAWETTVVRQRGPEVEHRSAWYLTRIISADASDTIHFDYRRHQISYAPTETQQQKIAVYTVYTAGLPTSSPPGGVVPNLTSVETQAVKLSRIRFATGYAEFDADLSSTARLDVPTEARLRSVSLYAYATQPGPARLIRQFELNHTYFQSSGGRQSRMNYRLRLDAVTERNGALSKPPHRFVYSPVALPPRDSFRQDHWGFFNNRNNLDLIPTHIFSTVYGPQMVGRARRAPDSAYVQAGLLRQIFYPTGGKTTLTFEPHLITERFPVRAFYEYRVNAFRAPTHQPVDFFTRFRVPDAGDVMAKLIMTITCHRDSLPTNGWPHNTGDATIRDVTLGYQTPPLRDIGGCGATTMHPNGIADSVLLEAGHTYELHARSDNPDMEAQVRVEWLSPVPPLVVPSIPVPAFHSYSAQGEVRDTLRPHVPVNAFTRFKVTSLNNVQARLTMRIYCGENTNSNGQRWPHNTGAARITDITPGYVTQLPLHEIAGCGTFMNGNSLTLLAGHTYQLQALADNRDMESYVQVEWQDNAQPAPPPAQYEYRQVLMGGVRIRSITSTAGANSPALTRRYAYQQEAQPGWSSGYRIGPPLQYAYKQEIRYTTLSNTNPGPIDPNPICNLLMMPVGQEATVHSSPLGLSGGQTVAYTTVSVNDGPRSGLTVSNYSACVDSVRLALPLLMPTDNSWRRGLLLSKKVYRSDGLVRGPLLERTTNTYSVDRRNQRVITGLKIMPYTVLKGSSCSNSWLGSYLSPLQFSYENSKQFAVWQHLDATVVRRYNPLDSTSAQVVTTLYEYANPDHAQVSTVKVSSSAGDTLVTRNFYPLDFAGTGATEPVAQGLQQLTSRRMLTSLVEQQQWRHRTGRTLVKGTLLHYDALRPKRLWKLEATAPVAPTAFQASAIQSGSFRQDARYQDAAVLTSYDAFGNVVQQQRPNGQPITYLWGYSSSYPVAEIKNATYAQVVAVLGQNVVDQFASRAPGSDALIYQQFRTLRFQLSQALVTTFTYAPLVGVTSQTDPAGRTTTYEYDGLGRLLRTRDERGAILSQQEYHYARP